MINLVDSEEYRKYLISNCHRCLGFIIERVRSSMIHQIQWISSTQLRFELKADESITIIVWYGELSQNYFYAFPGQFRGKTFDFPHQIPIELKPFFKESSND